MSQHQYAIESLIQRQENLSAPCSEIDSPRGDNSASTPPTSATPLVSDANRVAARYGVPTHEMMEHLQLTEHLPQVIGTVNLNYAPHIIDQRQLHIESNQYDLSHSTGAKVGKKFTEHQETPDATVQQRGKQAASHCEISKMKSTLEERANEESGKMALPVQANLRVSRVPLQISSQVGRALEGLDGEGHYNKRCDFDKALKSPKGNVKLCEVFDCAAAKAEDESQREGNNKARLKYIEHHGNIVAMIGQAGIGKTTLTRMLLQHIIDGDVLPEAQFMFYIPFREVDFVSETTLMKFALTGCCDWEHDEESDKRLLKALKDDPNVVFIFDGLDEASTERLSGNIPHCDIYSSRKADTFVAKILSRKFFPKAKKLLTSRPRQFYELHPDYRPKYVLDILGLNEEAQLELCRQICGDSHEVVMKYLKSHPDIFAICYVPVNCIITMSIINETLKEESKIDVRSLTDIFIRALQVFVESEHVRAYRNQIWKLCKLAWEGFLSKKIVFGERDFVDAEINEELLQAFLSTYVRGAISGKIMDGRKMSCFAHLTWHELFAALHLVMFLPLEEFRHLIERKKLREPLWEVVSKFLFGLCNEVVMERLLMVFYPILPKQWKDKKSALYSTICQCLSRESSDPEELLRLFHWIREADDGHLNSMVANHLPHCFRFPQSVLPTDVVNAAYALQHAVQPLTITFHDEVDISSHDLVYLCNQFALFPKKIKVLQFGRILIGDDATAALANCLHNVDELALVRSRLTEVGVQTTARRLKQCKIKLLRFGFNKIGDFGAVSIAECLSNINEIHLVGCGITAIGAKAIADQLKDCRIQSISLQGNCIGDDGAKALARCVCNIGSLDLSECDITEVGLEAIASQLKRCKIRSLDISSNNVGDKGATVIAKCVNNIENIGLADCGITAFGIEAISNKLKQGKIKILNLALDHVGDKGIKFLCECLSNVEEINLSKTSISTSGLKALASSLASLHRPMRCLLLTRNRMNDEGLTYLCEVLDKVEELKLSKNMITDAGVKILAKRLRQLNRPMKMLNVSGNLRIGNEGAVALALCLDKVEVLDLSYCCIGDQGVDAILQELARPTAPKAKVIGWQNQRRGRLRAHYYFPPYPASEDKIPPTDR